MRRNFLKIAVMAILVTITAGCGSSKTATTTAPSVAASPRTAKVTMPCEPFTMDKPGEYMAGLGVSSQNMSKRDAMLEANRAALADITTRYIGVIKNGTMSYMKDTSVPSGQKSSESKLEGIATTAGSKAINEYANRVCLEMEEDTSTGAYTAYTVVHVPIAKVISNIASALEVAKVDYDAEKFTKWLQQELDSQAASKNANQ
jgi:hypothetical protein